MAEIASQDFRDGVRHGAEALAARIVKAQRMGIEPSPHQIRAMAYTLGVEEYGGTAPEPGDEPCPTCSGPIRQTVGMVCQTCGTDYAAEPSSSETARSDR